MAGDLSLPAICGKKVQRYCWQLLLEIAEYLIAGFLITGGAPSRVGNSVEVYNPHSGSHCRLPDSPLRVRFGSSDCGNLLCTALHCLLFNPTTGQFTNTSVTLRQKRWGPLCWGGDDGDVLLMGGSYSISSTTTELVSADGSTSSDSFTLKYSTR